MKTLKSNKVEHLFLEKKKKQSQSAKVVILLLDINFPINVVVN